MKFLIPLLALPLFLSSCASKPSYGDTLISQGESTRAIGENWNKGSSLEKEGARQKEKGRRMIEEGEGLIKKGSRNMERGEELKAKSRAAAP